MPLNYRAIAGLVVEAIRAQGGDVAACPAGVTVRRGGVWSKPSKSGDRALLVDIERVFVARKVSSTNQHVREVVGMLRRDPDLWRDTAP